MILFCPDLTCKEEVKAIAIGQGDFTRPVLHACLKDQCVAYKNGRCVKYDNKVEIRENENKSVEERQNAGSRRKGNQDS